MNRLSKEEETLFDAYIVLTFARKVLQNDLAAIEQSFFKIKEPYIQLIHASLASISRELFEIKKQLHIRKITISFGENDGTFSEFHVFFRGYEHKSRFLNTHLRNKVQNKLNDFFVSTNKPVSNG